jgi:hypothetical protein
MEKYRKKDMLDLITMLEKANKSVTDLSQSSQPAVLDLLTQCQQTAIDLGNHLEQKGAAGERIVRLLEDYCENIYQQSQLLSDEKQFRTMSGIIQKQLEAITVKIQDEFPADKKEIVFLPYKASMWDALESVWRMAEADENCEAYGFYNRSQDFMGLSFIEFLPTYRYWKH